MQKTLVAGLLVCTVLGGRVAVAQPVEDFRHVMPVATQSKDGLQRVELPAAVHQGAARADLGDLRVFNAGGETLPFAFAGPRQKVQTKPGSFALPFFPQTQKVGAPSGGLDLQVKQLADGTLVSLRTAPKAETALRTVSYLVDASKIDEPIAALELDWTVTEDSRSGKLRVEASDNLKYWTTLASDAPLLDIEYGGEKLLRKRVEFDPVKTKYLRLTWQREAFKLTGLKADARSTTAPAEYRRIAFTAAPGEKPGEYLVDLGGRLPMERAALELPQANTVAPTRMFTRGDAKQPWREVGSATFYRLTRDGVELVAPPAEMSGWTERYLLLRVDGKGGGVGAGMPKLVVEWQPRSIVFAARGAGPFRIAYGNAAAAPAVFALPELLPGNEPGAEYKLPVASAGESVAQQVSEPTVVQQVVRQAGTKQGVLWLVLLVGVGFLGWMAWHLGRQLKTAPGAGGADASANGGASKDGTETGA